MTIRYDLISRRFGPLDGPDLLDPLIRDVFPGRIALVSSFGLESAVLLHMVAIIDPATPVIFLDTGKLFAETVTHRVRMAEHLGLLDVRTVRPAATEESAQDPRGAMWRIEPDRCCHMRKVAPLERALQGFQAWITGRKRFQGGQRTGLPTLEAVDWRLKVNPLASWNLDDLAAYSLRHDLPRHPLSAQGYTSVGCAPCTRPPSPDGGHRSGRWSGTDKTECGIHWSADGVPIRTKRAV